LYFPDSVTQVLQNFYNKDSGFDGKQAGSEILYEYAAEQFKK
jgi:hypothetical protein